MSQMVLLDQELELATMDALRGADSVKQRLTLEMSTGVPAISDLAYAIKIRVKEDFKIVEKVERKRRGDKPEYAVSSLRDLVGLRIVTLYRLDTLDILPVLLERIDAGAQNPDSVFSHRGIEEVIIYSTNPTGDAQDLPGRVRAVCHAFGLSEKTKVEQTPQNYTSIHIVVWCRGKYRSSYRDIPVEIQVRTAFEDVWGEIDHSLKYKRDGEAESVDKAEAARLELNEAHLNVMKTLIDGLAQYGDQIKLQMDGHRRIQAQRTRRSEQAIDRLEQFVGLDKAALKLAETAVSNAHAAMEVKGNQAAGRRSACRRAAGDLIRAVEKLRAMGLPKEHEREVHYVLEMERALLLFEIGNELGSASGATTLVEASRIYTQMAALFPNRAVPKYRLARTLDELGDHHASRKMYEEAVAALPDSELPSDHWLQSGTRRLLAFSLWEFAITRLQSPRTNEELEEAFADLLNAIAYTKDGLDAAQMDEAEKGKSLNNLLYFILDYRKHGGDESKLDALNLGPARVDDLLRELSEMTKDDVARLDTVRALRELQGDTAGAADAAKVIVNLLGDPSRRESWTTSDDSMLQDAEETLARNG